MKAGRHKSVCFEEGIEMEIQRLPTDEDSVRRYAEELWVPYNHDLETVVDSHTLAAGADLVTEQVEFALEKLESTDYRIDVAVDAFEPDTVAFDDGDLVGFIATNLDPSPSVFDWPDRLMVNDIYVHKAYRGTGLARELLERAEERARAEDYPKLVLDVDVDNDRALGFYRKLGFEPLRHRMTVDVDSLDEPE